MTLHPDAERLLANLRALELSPPSDETREPRRAAYDALLSAGAPREAVDHVADVEVPGPRPVLARTYRPDHVAPDGPALLWFFSGGWTIGSIDGADVTARALANAVGCNVVSVAYRLAPEHPFPAPLDDAWSAFAWARTRYASVAVGGPSAGGNLATVLCLLARDAGVAQPALQVMWYPVTDHDFARPSYVEHADGFLLDRVTMQWFFDCYTRGGADRDDWRISPLRAPELRGLAPAFVRTAEHDPLRDEGRAYARALADAGVPVDEGCAEGMIHLYIELRGLLAPGVVDLEATAAALRVAFADA
ncbi:MAG TPA: alpha/beta hydrolase [Acidimicrobiia bacterium]|nr:alpha/beta hydrolase [Acidimicrobiia bacterium]